MENKNFTEIILDGINEMLKREIDEMLKREIDIEEIVKKITDEAKKRLADHIPAGDGAENGKQEARMEPDPPFNPETMMTTHQAAERLGVSDKHVLELSRVREGKTPALHRYGVPGKYYFPKEDVERYAETRKNRGGAARFFTPAEAANYSGILAPKLRKLEKSGKLKTVRKGRRKYFSKYDLDSYINMQRRSVLPFNENTTGLIS